MAKKRTNGEGSFSQRADGRWCWKMMDGYTPEGKPNTVVIYGKTQKEVKEKVKQYQRDKEDGLKIDRKLTFSAWADTWFESLSGVEESTREGYRYTARKLKEHFGKRKLVDIRPLDVENYIHEMQQNGLSDSYIAKLRGMLFQIMNKAAANDLIRKNPVKYAEKSKSVNPPKEKEAFTAEEVRLLMEKLPENRLGWSIRLMLGTGMRGQELLALQKEYIEEDGSVIHIRQAVKLVKGKTTIGPPKSKSSTRDIPVAFPGSFQIRAEGDPRRPCFDAAFLSTYLCHADAGLGCRSANHSEHCRSRRSGHDGALSSYAAECKRSGCLKI